MKKKEMKVVVAELRKRVAELEAEAKTRESHEVYNQWAANRGTSGGSFGFGHQHRDLESGRFRWSPT